MQGENLKLKQFLIGNLSDDAMEEVGVRIIADRAYAENIRYAEAELMEDFLDDELSAEEKELFRRNFLTTAARRERLREIALLRNYAQAHLAEALGAGAEKKPASFFEKLKGFLSLNLKPVAAALIILVLAGVAWRVFLTDGSLTETEKNYAALNAKDLSNAPEIANLSSKSLSIGTFRSGDEASKLTAANLTDSVLFRLAMPAGTPAGSRFDFELSRGGQTVFRQKELRVYQNPNGQELKVVLPKSVLSKGNYQIKLSNNLTYGFTVE